MVKTINQSYKEQYQQTKKRKIFRKIFLFLVLSFGLTGGTIYALFFSDIFNVREVNIANSSFIKNSEVRSVVDGYLSKKKFLIPRFKNILLVDAEQINTIIGHKFPAAENIKVEKKYFHALEISLNQKKAVGIWCYKKQGECFYFDRERVAFDSVTETSGALLINVSDERGDFKSLGQPVASRELLDLILEAGDQLNKAKIEAIKFVIPAGEDFRFDVKTSEGWTIYFSTKDDFSRQLSSLELFLAQKITLEKRSQLQYIDLTVPNRVYYK